MESLKNIPDNISVFVDANIFIYHFCGPQNELSNHCSDFLLKVENEQIQAITSTLVLAEVLHRAMIFEAIGKTGLSPQGAMNKLKKSPKLVKSLNRYLEIPNIITDIGIQVVTISLPTILNSTEWRRNYGILVNDSIILATMMHYKTQHLVTNDSDFDNISEITVWKPDL